MDATCGIPRGECECSSFQNYSDFHSCSNATTYCENANFDNSSVHWIFRINYMYYSFIGTVLVAVCGYPISILTGGTENLDPKLLSPLFRGSYKPKIEKPPVEMKFIDEIITADEIEKLKEADV
jgi:hypothetical protein